MKEVKFLEKLAEDLLEGSFDRAFKPRLQPVQIAKALTREMERSRIVAAEGPLVANQYTVFLHPDDLAGFVSFRLSLERDLAHYLEGYATRNGLRPVSPPSVTLETAPADQKRGRLAILAALVDVEPPAHPPTVEPPSTPRIPEVTVEMPVVVPAQAPSAERPPAYLVGSTGQPVPLVRSDTSLGRAMDNDLVLEAKGVSRHHARLRWDSGRYLLVDLDSTNGTFVAGKRISRHALSDREEITLGGTRFLFRLGSPEQGEASPR